MVADSIMLGMIAISVVLGMPDLRIKVFIIAVYVVLRMIKIRVLDSS